MRRHVCAAPSGPGVDTVHRWRLAWDPVMASVVPPHVTVVYPEETVDERLLLRRARRHLATVRPFRLRLGGVLALDGGRGGVFVAVEDVDGGWAAVRGQLLAPPMNPLDVPAHLTVAHPRTSSRGEQCWAALRDQHLDAEIRVRELLFTATTADTCTVLHRFPLDGSSAG